jgi:lysophospholipase L1-like esterase
MRPGWLAALLPILLGGCATIAPAPDTGLAEGAEYVSLGSSFAAGAGIGPIQPGTPARCNRTVNNYASLLAERRRLKLVDVSCGGATTAHVLGRWEELPPQIDAVSSATRLVTITIGGNDLGYVGWLFASSCRLGVAARPGPCQTATEPTEATYTELDRNLRAIAAAVRERAPQARLVFIQYVTLLSAQPCERETVASADAAVASRVADRLARITAQAAQASGAEVLASDTLSRPHTPCSPEPWSNGLFQGYDIAAGAPWHPNAAGHAAIAEELAELL